MAHIATDHVPTRRRTTAPGASCVEAPLTTIHGTDAPSSLREGETAFGPFTLRWTETGATDGPVVLLLHGIYAGANAFEWRDLVPLLDGEVAGSGPALRVRVPDLLGAGLSDRPDLEYDPEIVLGAVTALIADAGPDCQVVASSLTGAYAVKALAHHPDTGGVRLTLVTPTGLGSAQAHRGGIGSRLAYALGRHTPIGDAVVAALTSGPSVRWFQRHKSYADPQALTADEVAETRRAGRLPNAKHLQLAFVTGRLALPVERAEVRRTHPLVVWGRGQAFADDADMARWQAAGAKVVALTSGLPQVEEPERLADLLRAA